MKHLYIEGKGSDWTLILFHGTGGRETDLLDVATMIDSGANILAFRGDVEERGQTRFFKRLPNGAFDEDSLKEEADKIYQEIINLSNEYPFDLSKSVTVGFSNGANIASYLHLNYDLAIPGGVLMHPSYRTETMAIETMLDKSFLLTAGARDMIATAGETYELKKHLELKGAKVQVKLTDGPHAIVSDELMEAHVWLLHLKKELSDD